MDNPSQGQSGSLILGNCLSCQGLVRVPAKAPSDSMVRCPHCSESYRLAQIIDQAVPQLEIVADAKPEPVVARVDQVLINERESFVVPPQLSKGARRSGRRRSNSGSSSERKRSGESSRNGERDTAARSKSSPSGGNGVPSFATSSRRPKTSTRNPTVEMIKVVVGGLLAIPIAYMLVLWVFQQDPINVAPKINQVAPFLVPAALREEAIESEKSAEPAESLGDSADAQNLDVAPIPKLDPGRALDPGVDESE